jgi:hypothetical protein
LRRRGRQHGLLEDDGVPLLPELLASYYGKHRGGISSNKSRHGQQMEVPDVSVRWHIDLAQLYVHNTNDKLVIPGLQNKHIKTRCKLAVSYNQNI